MKKTSLAVAIAATFSASAQVPTCYQTITSCEWVQLDRNDHRWSVDGIANVHIIEVHKAEYDKRVARQRALCELPRTPRRSIPVPVRLEFNLNELNDAQSLQQCFRNHDYEAANQSSGGGGGGGGGGAGVAVGAIAAIGLAVYALSPSSEFTPSFTYEDEFSGSTKWSDGFWSGYWNTSNQSGIAYDNNQWRLELDAEELSYSATASLKLEHENWTLTPFVSFNKNEFGNSHQANVKLNYSF